MLQELGLLRIAIRRVSGELGVERVVNHALVEKVWIVVMAQTHANNQPNLNSLTQPFLFKKAKEKKDTLELEIYYQSNNTVN